MRMSELVSSMGLTIFPIIGLVGFGAAFVLILLRVAQTRKPEAAANAAIPLDDGTVTDSSISQIRSHTTPRTHGGAA